MFRKIALDITVIFLTDGWGKVNNINMFYLLKQLWLFAACNMEIDHLIYFPELTLVPVGLTNIY